LVGMDLLQKSQCSSASVVVLLVASLFEAGDPLEPLDWLILRNLEIKGEASSAIKIHSTYLIFLMVHSSPFTASAPFPHSGHCRVGTSSE